MAVQDYELLLRVRTDLQDALRGLDGVRKRLDEDAAAAASLSKSANAASSSLGQLASSNDASAGRIQKNAAATRTLGVSAGQTANAMRQLPAQITDIVTGLASGQGVFTVAIQQGGQLRDSFGSVGGVFRALSTILTPTRLLIGAGAAAIGGLAFAAIEGARETQALNAAIAQSGNYAGVTVGEIRALSKALSGADGSGSISDYTEALRQLVASGKVAGDQLAVTARAAVSFSAATGESMDKAVAKISGLAEDPLRAIKALDEQYNVLSIAQQQQIQLLLQQGNSEQALSIAQQAAAQEFGARAAQVKGQLSEIGRLWDGVKDAASNAWEAMKGTLQQSSISEDLAAVRDQISRTKQELIEIGGLTDAQAERTAQVQALRSQESGLQPGALLEKWAAQTEATGLADRAAVKKGLAYLDDAISQYDTSSQKYVRQINAINKAADDAIAKAPNLADQINTARTSAVRRAAGAFTDSQSKGGKSAAKADDTRKYVEAQQSLRDSLTQLQNALDPTAALWNAYNKAVEKANADAELGKKAKGADAAAIDGQRTAIIALATAQRDAGLKRLSDADRKSFEQLRDSLRTPAEVKLQDAAAQIQQLNQYLKDGVISSKEYSDALSAVSKSSITDLPQYQGVDAAVGGVTSELSKNFEAQQTLDDAYAQKLAANEAFRAQDAANEEVYQQRLALLQDQYATQRNKIESSRQQLQLQASSDFFGQLAVLSKSGNSKIAAVGKAAAIAKTIIDTYSSATAAYNSLASIPYIGPVLGAAAAAAAIAAGLANVAQIRSQPTGFSGGGYTGPGGKYEYAGPAHRGEVIWSQEDVARVGGPSVAEAIRLGKVPGYADGGYVRAYTDTSSFAASRAIAATSAYQLSAPSASTTGSDPGETNVFLVMDKEELADKLLQTKAGARNVIQHVGDNPRQIQGKWSG